MKHVTALLLLLITTTSLRAQDFVTRRSAQIVLDRMHNDIRREYFDSTFGGVNLDSLKRVARARIKAYKSEVEINLALADYLRALGDSHTYYLPPAFVDSYDYGFGLKFFGDQLLITDVKAGSDAARQGLGRGDQVLMLDGRTLDRSSFPDFAYDYYVLAPRRSVQLQVRTPAGRIRQFTIATGVRRGVSRNARGGPVAIARLAEDLDSLEQTYAHRYVEFGKAFVWKMPAFLNDDGKIGQLIDRARTHDALILDLRSNGGGSAETLRDLVSRVMPAETEIATLRERSKVEVLKARPAKHTFDGKVFVLVDSETASAAEVFARLMQLTGRGVVIGDRTAGAVRASLTRTYDVGGLDAAANITVSDLFMPDGSRLEGSGVTPNEYAVLKCYDLAEHSDPVLSYALSLAGVEVDAAEAGKLFNDPVDK